MPAAAHPEPTIELTLTNPAVGGEVVGRQPDGRVVFVRGGLPGETVRVAITDQRRSFARGETVEVLDPAPDRVEPPCAAVSRGCGGCDLQHLRVEAQPELKAAVVRDALVRLGHIEAPQVRPGVPLRAQGFRTSIRVAVRDGRAGFRRRASHDLVEVAHCLVAHPALDDLLVRGGFGAAEEVTLRVGAATGERLVLASPTVAGLRLPADVIVVGTDDDQPANAVFHDEVSGFRFRISPRSFFQTRTDGAQALVAAVVEAAGPLATGPARIVDAYCGVGLFARTVGVGGGEGRTVVAIERGRASVADARHNLAGHDVQVVEADVARWESVPADLVIADPSRDGLGAEAVDRLAATGASRLVLVSCDAGALGRDAGLLEAAGLRFIDATLVDLFPHTHHIEVVSTFLRD